MPDFGWQTGRLRLGNALCRRAERRMFELIQYDGQAPVLPMHQRSASRKRRIDRRVDERVDFRVVGDLI